MDINEGKKENSRNEGANSFFLCKITKNFQLYALTFIDFIDNFAKIAYNTIHMCENAIGS